MNLFQILIRREEIERAATSLPPAGPGFAAAQAMRADCLLVYGSTERDGPEHPFYEYRLRDQNRLLAARKISGMWEGGSAANSVAVAPLAAVAPFRGRSKGDLRFDEREAIMATTQNDALQQAINAINELSSLVGRYAFAHSPEEADDAQRRGFEAMKYLRELKDAGSANASPSATVDAAGSQEHAEAA
ncbi:MAG TPA: hypothetical protein VF507_09025 [Pyrinomonadaceae bacterium]